MSSILERYQTIFRPVYVGLGVFIFHNIYKFPLLGLLSGLISAVLVFSLLYWADNQLSKIEDVTIRRKIPRICFLSSFFIIIFSFAGFPIKGALDPWSICLIAGFALTVALSILSHPIMIEPFGKFERDSLAELEALKLEHEFYMRVIDSFAMAVVILFTGAVIVFMVKNPQFTASKLAIVYIFPSFFIIAGLIAGVVGPIFNRLDEIRRRIKKLRLKNSK